MKLKAAVLVFALAVAANAGVVQKAAGGLDKVGHLAAHGVNKTVKLGGKGIAKLAKLAW